MKPSTKFVIRRDVLVRYTGKETHVTVPEGVAVIGAQAFADKKTIESVTLPEGVEEIGYGAFQNCGKLKEIVFPASLKKLHYGAFEQSLWIQEQPPAVVVNHILYRYRGRDSHVVIPDGVTAIGCGAFYHSFTVESVALPASVREIGQQAFYACTSLKAIDIPEGVTKIDIEAFGMCQALREVTLPDSLETVEVAAFRHCDRLREVTLGSRVHTICAQAFAGCDALRTIRFPDSLRTIGRDAFSGTAWLAAQASFAVVNRILYRYQGAEAEVTIPDGIDTVSDEAFVTCRELCSVTVPDSVTQLGRCTFRGCMRLRSVTLGCGLRTLDEGVFCDCRSLDEVTVPEGVETIESLAFEKCKALRAVTLPSTLRTLGNGVFYRCESLKALTIPEATESVQGSILDQCTGLLDVQCKESMFPLIWEPMAPETKVNWCFNRLTAGLPLRERKQAYVSRRIGEIVATAIRQDAAQPLTAALALKKTVPLDKLDRWIADSADAPAVRAVLLEYKTKTYSRQAVEKYETAKEEKELGLRPRTAADWKQILKLRTAEGKATVMGIRTEDTELEIPPVIGRSTVTAVGTGAFCCNKQLRTVVLPDTVQSIKNGAFLWCRSLTAVVIPDGVTDIGNNVFDHCPDLTLYGKAGSYAEQYAKKKKIPFVAE